jgi:hypothetical protein
MLSLDDHQALGQSKMIVLAGALLQHDSNLQQCADTVNTRMYTQRLN